LKGFVDGFIIISILGMCSLVALSFFFLLVSENMPPSDNVPLVGGYYSVTMMQMGLSFFMNVLVLRFHHMTDEKVPDWVRVCGLSTNSKNNLDTLGENS
jgi:hypothetical protein